MSFCFSQEILSFLKRPIRCSMQVIVLTDLIQSLPMFQNFAISLAKPKPGIINMIWLCTTAVEFKDRIIFPLFQFLYRIAFNVITAIIEFIGVVAEFIKNF